MRFYVIIIFLIIISFSLKGQEENGLFYNTTTINNGLPSNIVYFVYKDSKNIIWICTDKGLVKYNGYSYETLTTKNGLEDNEVFSLIEDKYNRLWLSTFTGSLSYYKNGQIHIFKHELIEKNWDKNTFTYILLKNSLGSVFVNQSKSPILFEINENKVTTTNFNDFAIKSIAILQAPRDSLVIYGLDSSLNINRYNFYRKKNETKWSLSSKQFIVSTQNSYGLSKVIKNENGEYILTPNTLKIDTLKNFLKESKTISLLTLENNFEIEFSNNKIAKVYQPTCIYKKANNEFWISTLGKGIYKLYPDVYKEQVKKEGIIFSKKINDYTIESNKKGIFFTHQGKTIFINHINNKILRNIEFINNRLYIIYLDKVAISKFKITEMPKSNFEFEIFYTGYIKTDIIQDTSLIVNTIYRILRLSYPLSVDTLLKTNKRINDIVVYKNKIQALHLDQLWELEKNSIRLKDSSMLFKQIETLGNTIYALSKGNELYYKPKENLGFSKLTNELYDKIETADSKTILLRSNSGFLVFRQTNQNVSTYKIPNIMLPNDIQTISIQAKKVLVFTQSLEYKYNLQDFAIKLEKPLVVFNNFFNNNSIFNTTSSELYVKKESLIKINLDCITTDNEAPHLYYKINDSKWIESDNLKSISLNLENGENKIFIKCINSFNIQSDIVNLTIYARYPFWKSTLFWVITTGLLILLLSYLLNKQANKRKQKQFEQKILNIQNEFKFLNALMNPHFIFNSMNSISYLIANNSNKEAEKYITVLSKLIRQNMENLNSTFIPLSQELNLVKNYFDLETLRFKSKIKLVINETTNPFLYSTHLPPLTLQPLVENAIKHGFNYGELKGVITIDAFEINNRIEISISDTGTGLKKDTLQSMALRNLQKRLEDLSQLTKNNYLYTIENIIEKGEIIGCVVKLIIEKK